LGGDDGGGVFDSLAFGAVGGVISCYPPRLRGGGQQGRGAVLWLAPLFVT
jgi:hypothetical protein